MYFSSFWSEGYKYGCRSSCTLTVCFLTATSTGLSRGLEGWGLSLQKVVVQTWVTVSFATVGTNSLRGGSGQEFDYCWDDWTPSLQLQPQITWSFLHVFGPVGRFGWQLNILLFCSLITSVKPIYFSFRDISENQLCLGRHQRLP